VPADPSQIVNGSGRQVRSAVQMSEYAPFADGGTAADPTDQSRSFISYYTYGAAIALALDLSLRDLSAGRVSLDDVMRELWRAYGSPEAPPGLVAHPYTLDDVRDAVAAVSGNRAFADGFFQRYVDGRDVPDFRRLLGLAGFSLAPRFANLAWTGVEVRPDANGVAVGGGSDGGLLVPFGTPAYDAGIEVQDVVRTIDGQPATVDAWNALRSKKPGDRVSLAVVGRDGVARDVSLTLAADPRLGTTDLRDAMTPAQRAFRAAWLGSRVN
jgi:predicted metalloprotease with PDZ domain